MPATATTAALPLADEHAAEDASLAVTTTFDVVAGKMTIKPSPSSRDDVARFFYNCGQIDIRSSEQHSSEPPVIGAVDPISSVGALIASHGHVETIEINSPGFFMGQRQAHSVSITAHFPEGRIFSLRLPASAPVIEDVNKLIKSTFGADAPNFYAN